MNLFSLFPRPLLLAVPAILAFSACGKDDKPAPAAPDKARVLAVHAAVNQSTRPIKVSVGDKQGPSVAYGSNTGYQEVGTGSLSVKAMIDATGGATLYDASQTLAKDKHYSFFAYNAPMQTASTVSGLFVEDNLAAPAANMAKIRLVHLGLNIDSPLSISRTPTGGGALTAVTTLTAAGQASAFVEVPAAMGNYNLANSSNSAIQPAAGAAVLATPFVNGGVYSIIIRGASVMSAPSANEYFTLQLLKHN
jgi:hypothetical protein